MSSRNRVCNSSHSLLIMDLMRVVHMINSDPGVAHHVRLAIHQRCVELQPNFGPPERTQHSASRPPTASLPTMVNKLELFALTTLFLTPAFVILSHCVAAPSLFAVHPAANAVAHLVLSPAAIYIMIQRKSIADFNTRLALVKTHFVLQLLAFLVMSAGGAAIYLNKDKFGKEHFTSLHSWVAGGSATLWSLNLLGGVGTTFLGTKADWVWKNPGHRVGGVLGFIGCGVAVVYGLYSGQWAEKTLGADKRFKVAALVVAAYASLFLKAMVSLTTKPKVSKKTA